jgi:hypothetical protein
MRTTDHDSIIIQRKRGTQSHYSNLAVLKSDVNSYQDIKPNVKNIITTTGY